MGTCSSKAGPTALRVDGNGSIEDAKLKTKSNFASNKKSTKGDLVRVAPVAAGNGRENFPPSGLTAIEFFHLHDHEAVHSTFVAFQVFKLYPPGRKRKDPARGTPLFLSQLTKKVVV